MTRDRSSTLPSRSKTPGSLWRWRCIWLANTRPATIRSQMKRTTIRRQSPQRARQLRVDAKLAKTYLFDHPSCEICQKGSADQIYHRASRIRHQLNIVEERQTICQACHDRIQYH